MILAALLLQRGKLSRAQDSGTSSWSATAVLKPMPEELRRLPEVVWAKTAAVRPRRGRAHLRPEHVRPELPVHSPPCAMVVGDDRRVARDPHRLGRPHQPRPVRHRRRRRARGRQPVRRPQHRLLPRAGRRRRRRARWSRCSSACPRCASRGCSSRSRRSPSPSRSTSTSSTSTTSRRSCPPACERPLLWERFDLERRATTCTSSASRSSGCRSWPRTASARPGRAASSSPRVTTSGPPTPPPCRPPT